VAERTFSQEAERLVVAHRGASAVEAENTLEAFELAIATGADVIEFDVRMTADDVAIVMHDPHVDRTTDGAGLVRDLRLAELKGLRIRTRDGGATEVPTLEEALRCLSGRAAVDVEIKNVPGEPDFAGTREPAVDATIRALDAVGFVGPVLLSSFNPLSIAHARSTVPGVATGLLTVPDVGANAAFAFAREHGHDWVLPFVEDVRSAGASLVGEIHEAAMRIGTWITDDPGTAVELMRMRVDAVATNDPLAIVAARAAAFGH
jgi:glycerophosphoryl diester phosphodiesterase